MSPTQKTRISTIRRLWQLILTIDSPGILFAAATSHHVAWASRAATRPAIGRRQAVLASHRREVAGHVTCLARARHAAAQTLDLISVVSAAVARDHQFPQYGYSALTESLAGPLSQHPRSRRLSPCGITNNPSAWPMRLTPALPFPDSRKILSCDHRHSRMEMLPGG
jgi:hypothetical protein